MVGLQYIIPIHFSMVIKMKILITLIILLLSSPCLASGPIFLGLVPSGGGGGLGGCSDDGGEDSYKGDAWANSCQLPCYEDINCDLWESPCVFMNVGTADIQGARDVDSLFDYCQDNPGLDNYCDPGLCDFAPRLRYDASDWAAQGSWQNPLYKEEAGAYNLYPLYINSGRTSICSPTGIDLPTSWYNFAADANWLAYYYAGGNKASGWIDTVENNSGYFYTYCSSMLDSVFGNYHMSNCTPYHSLS